MMYLAGKVRGLEPQEVANKFADKAAYLREQYQTRVLNPVQFIEQENKMRMRIGKSILTDKDNRQEIIDMCLRKLSECKAIYLMRCYEDSAGARAEHAYAIATGMKIYYEL